MSVNTLKLYSQQPNGVTYCDPLNPDFIVRFKSTSGQKVIDGNRVQNVICEISANDSHSVTIGGGTAIDALSVRVRTSGSLMSVPRLKQMLTDMVTGLDAWMDEDVLIGFNPTTPPINTVS